jgi:hypothetical protein
MMTALQYDVLRCFSGARGCVPCRVAIVSLPCPWLQSVGSATEPTDWHDSGIVVAVDGVDVSIAL